MGKCCWPKSGPSSYVIWVAFVVGRFIYFVIYYL